MPELMVIQLRPRSAFLLGRRGVGQEATGNHLPADTLFAALMAAWAEWGGRPEEWLAGFPTSGGPGGEILRSAQNDSPPFLLTSAFPFAGGVRFYPKPMLAFDVGEQSKALKKAHFVSEQIFRWMLAGEPPATWLPPQNGNTAHPTVTLQHGALWLTQDEYAHLPDGLRFVDGNRRKERSRRALNEMSVYMVDKVPRVTVDRLRHASEIYHTGRLSFAPECGLWLGVQWVRPDAPFPGADRPYRQVFLDMLTALGDQGLGGERSAGYGAFEVEPQAAPLRFGDPAAGGLFVTLSRYHPRPDELPATLSSEGAAYQLEAVGGWLKSLGVVTQRRRRVWMCAEGSVCRAVGDGPWGDVVDVQPRYEKVTSDMHPVWRYGLACAVGTGGG